MTKIILVISLAGSLAACQTAPLNPVGSGLDTKGLEAACKAAPALTAEVNSSETLFLTWIADFNSALEDCSNRHSRLVEVLRRNQVLK